MRREGRRWELLRQAPYRTAESRGFFWIAGPIRTSWLGHRAEQWERRGLQSNGKRGSMATRICLTAARREAPHGLTGLSSPASANHMVRVRADDGGGLHLAAVFEGQRRDRQPLRRRLSPRESQ